MSIASSINQDVLRYKNAFGQARTEVRLDRGGYHFLQVIEGVPVAEHGLNSGDTLYIEV